MDASSAPLIYQLSLGGSIDASPFVDTDGSAYLVWKADSNAIRQPSSLWIQALDDDGLTLRGQPTRLLNYDADWENPLIEAPSVVVVGGLLLLYSADWWNTNRYSIGYATATHVLGPYAKVTTQAPWYSSDSAVAGPGGQGVVHRPRWWVAHGVPRLATVRGGVSRGGEKSPPGIRVVV